MALSDFSGGIPGPSGSPYGVAGTRRARPSEISHVLVIFRVLPCPGLRPRQRLPGPCLCGPVLVAFHQRGRCRPLHHVLTRLHPFTLRLRPGSRSVYTSPAASRRRAQHSIPSGWLALRRVGIAPTGKCQLFVAYPLIEPDWWFSHIRLSDDSCPKLRARELRLDLAAHQCERR